MFYYTFKPTNLFPLRNIRSRNQKNALIVYGNEDKLEKCYLQQDWGNLFSGPCLGSNLNIEQ